MVKVDKSRVRVLVTDDEESIRSMIALTLKDDGWAVDTAVNGRDGFDKLKTQPYHIILSDIQMPEMTGIEFLEKVKANYPNTEFVIMTSNATLETAMNAIRLGAYDYLTKPFEDLSVATKKIMQVAEKIMLRQQNNELLKRLRKSSQDLKLLYEMVHQLNGTLEEDSLAKSATEILKKLFQDETTQAAWLINTAPSQWKVIQQTPENGLFTTTEVHGSVDEIKNSLSAKRNLSVLGLQDEGKPTRILVYENLQASLAPIYQYEVSRCFEKVMRHQDVVSLANRDGLTKLYNHRYFQDRLRQELSQVKRQNGDLSVVLIDVDHFKKYNDNHGHPMGDQLLKELAMLFDKESARRDSDIVARYGGEEFIFLLPFTDYEGGLVKAERIRSMVEAHVFPQGETQPLGKISLSIGVATFPQDAISASTLIECADKALYQAKHQGRNQVVGYAAVKSGAESSKKTDQPKATLGAVLEPPTPPTPVATPAPVAPSPTPTVAPSPAPTAALADIELSASLEPVAPSPSNPRNTQDLSYPTAPEVKSGEITSPVAPTMPVPTPMVAPLNETNSALLLTMQVFPESDEKKTLRKKTVGPEVDVDSLVASIESVVEQVAAERKAEEIKTVSFVEQAAQESLDKKGQGHGTGG